MLPIFSLDLALQPTDYPQMDFDLIFKKYHHRLYLFALKFVENEGEALDIVQNVFLAVWENNKFRTEERFVHAYLFNAVKNSCLNQIKHRSVVHRFEKRLVSELKELEAFHFQSGEESLIEREIYQQLEEAIQSLTDPYKEVIVLSRLEGLKNLEIADRLQIPVRTVETRIYRALSSLRQKLTSRKDFILLTLFKKFPKKVPLH